MSVLVQCYPLQTDLTNDKMKSLLLVRDALCHNIDTYSYLDIGSQYGSLVLSNMIDARCKVVKSVDGRVIFSKNGDGTLNMHTAKSTEEMISRLRKFVDEEEFDKLSCIECDPLELEASDVVEGPKDSYNHMHIGKYTSGDELSKIIDTCISIGIGLRDGFIITVDNVDKATASILDYLSKRDLGKCYILPGGILVIDFLLTTANNPQAGLHSYPPFLPYVARGSISLGISHLKTNERLYKLRRLSLDVWVYNAFLKIKASAIKHWLRLF